jgi:small-conductance mechanosensitive channel
VQKTRSENTTANRMHARIPETVNRLTAISQDVRSTSVPLKSLLAQSVHRVHRVTFGGIGLIGFTAETTTKLWLTLGVTLAIVGARLVIGWIVRGVAGRRAHERIAFWTNQTVSLAALGLMLITCASIWFDDTARLTSVAGIATAGIAIAAQKAVTAFAGYLVLMRGKTFTVGDRIKMGGVRGDVISVGFLQTRIMEMGQPNEVNQQEDPGMWVRARQFTGRTVTVTNDKVFEEPVYNFTREFPFIWEEMHVPIPYRADRTKAETILLDAVTAAVRPHTEGAAAARDALTKKYGVDLETLEPRAFWQLTDNWLEMTVRFIVPDHGIRNIKDEITRVVLREFDAARIDIASTSMEVTVMKDT